MASNEDEAPPPAKSAEDRKAASALANLDSSAAADDATAPSSAQVDHNAITKAMKGLPSRPAPTSSSSSSSLATAAAAGARGASTAHGSKDHGTKPIAKKSIKLAPEDVALVVDQLELSKPRASELLRQHEGDAVAVLRIFAAGYRE